MSIPVRPVGLWLAPGFSPLALGGVLDALAAANALQEDCHYQPLLCAEQPLPLGDQGLVLPSPDSHTVHWHALLVLAGEAQASAFALDCLARWSSQGVALGGVGAGVAWLAQAGLMGGRRACSDWPLLDALQSAHPEVAWSEGLWDLSADGLRLSCASGAAVLDLMLAWLGRLHGEVLGRELQQQLGWPALRPAETRQVAQQRRHGEAASPKLNEALTLMEANLGEPLPTEDIARLVGVSRRQLERLFRQHLDTLPSRHYLALRLARAQRLLQHSAQSILQVGLSCGFASGPHFSNAYKAHYGHTPRDERSRRLLQLRGAALKDLDP